MRSLVRWVIEVVLIAVLMIATLVWGIHHGKEQGKKDALFTQPPSDELELVCAGLWVGEQNKKQWEKEQRK